MSETPTRGRRMGRRSGDPHQNAPRTADLPTYVLPKQGWHVLSSCGRARNTYYSNQ